MVSKKYLPTALFILAGLFVFFAIQRSCTLHSKYSELKGQYEALAKEHETYKRVTEEEAAHLRKRIEDQDKIIVAANKEIAKKHERIARLDEELAGLEEKADKTQNLAKKVTLLERQINIWKQKFSLAQGVIADKDKIIFSLTEKYQTQVRITQHYKTLYEREAQLRELLEKRVKIADSKIKGLNFKLGLSNAAWAVIAGVAVLIVAD
ncbi:MAG: hypothetical protein JRI41_06765 [Deltaproteobacteria bacterium]|nr:hypothetical protein [Deltaproteobacteria bacterium]